MNVQPTQTNNNAPQQAKPTNPTPNVRPVTPVAKQTPPVNKPAISPKPATTNVAPMQ